MTLTQGIAAQTEGILTRVETAEAEVAGILQIEHIVLGCNDPEANNYDEQATVTFPGACNYMMRSCAAILEAMPGSASGGPSQPYPLLIAPSAV